MNHSINGWNLCYNSSKSHLDFYTKQNSIYKKEKIDLVALMTPAVNKKPDPKITNLLRIILGWRF